MTLIPAYRRTVGCCVTEGQLNNTGITVHKPTVGPFINNSFLRQAFIYIGLSSRHIHIKLSHAVAHCCIYTQASRLLYAPVDTALLIRARASDDRYKMILYCVGGGGGGLVGLRHDILNTIT